MKENFCQQVAEELKNINTTLVKDQKNKKEQEEKKDRMWTNFGIFRDEITLLKDKVEKHERTLFCDTPLQEGIVILMQKQFNMSDIRFKQLEGLIRASDEKQDKRFDEVLKPVQEDISEIKNRNIAKDAIQSWKSNLPNFITNLVTTIGTIIATYFLMR